MTVEISELALGKDANFSIAAVFARCFRTYRRRFLPFALVTFALILPFAIFLLVATSLFLRNHTPPDQKAFAPILLPLTILCYLGFYATQSVLFTSAYRDMSGQPITLGASVGRGLLRLPVAFLAAVLTWFVVVAGWAALMFPGIVIFTMTAVTVPACVLEGLGPFAAISRSTALTKGHRWRILAIYLIEIVACYGAFSSGQLLLNRLLPSYLATPFTLVIQIAALAFAAVLNTAVYFELRAAKDGIGADGLAAVFD